MRHGTEISIDRVVRAMQENLGRSFTNDEIARIALFSKFHFSRIFQDATGLSPARFLAALRIAEAKRLLLATSLSVTDISITVGHASVGTFSTRFKSSVGVSPSIFRANGGFRPQPPYAPSRASQGADITGIIGVGGQGPIGPIFVGLFPEMIPMGLPAQCMLLARPGPFHIACPPDGKWYLLAYSQFYSTISIHEQGVVQGDNVLVGSAGPISVQTGVSLESSVIRLHPRTRFDPPVLLAPFDVAASRHTYEVMEVNA
jgi:AraC family transcriptional regulator